MDDRRIILRAGGARSGEPPADGPAGPSATPPAGAGREPEPVAVLRTGQPRPEPEATPRPTTAPAFDRRESPPSAPRRGGGLGRTLLLAGGAALVLGIGAGLLLTRGDESDRPAPSQTAERSSSAMAAGADADAAEVAYAPPSAEQVTGALERVRADYARGGASAVEQGSRACFRTLEEAPSYGDLDFCLAYDQFGAAMMRRLAGGAAPAGDSWFGRVDARGAEAAGALMGSGRDPQTRVADVRRLAATASRAALTRTQTAANDAPDPTPVEPPARVEVAEAPPPPIPAAPTRAPERPAAAETEPDESREAADAPRPAPAPQPRAEARELAEAEPAPRPRRRQVREDVRPSFNCRYARSRAERMVCSDPVLAAADWRLHETFERAMAEARNPRRLRAEQDRWLAAREAAAPDPGAVLDVYESRIDELSSRY